MNEGWFKIHRCLFKKAIWIKSTAEQKVILITLLGMANHEGKEWEWKGKQFKAKAGQFITSSNSIMSKSGIGISRQNIRTALTKFKKYDFLTYESTNTGIFVDIVNWGAYQGEKIIANQAINQKITNSKPTPNQHITTNKNDKNVKNDKKYIYISQFTQNRQLMETIIDFMKMRAEINKPMTDRALQLMLNKLKALSDNEEIRIKILENSIENCWQGIFELREKKEIIKGMEKNQRGLYVRERKYKVFSDGEGDHGIFEQNTGGSKKKFNIKIPKWEPNRVFEDGTSGASTSRANGTSLELGASWADRASESGGAREQAGKTDGTMESSGANWEYRTSLEFRASGASTNRANRTSLELGESWEDRASESSRTGGQAWKTDATKREGSAMGKTYGQASKSEFSHGQTTTNDEPF